MTISSSSREPLFDELELGEGRLVDREVDVRREAELDFVGVERVLVWALQVAEPLEGAGVARLELHDVEGRGLGPQRDDDCQDRVLVGGILRDRLELDLVLLGHRPQPGQQLAGRGQQESRPLKLLRNHEVGGESLQVDPRRDVGGAVARRGFEQVDLSADPVEVPLLVEDARAICRSPR